MYFITITENEQRLTSKYTIKCSCVMIVVQESFVIYWWKICVNSLRSCLTNAKLGRSSKGLMTAIMSINLCICGRLKGCCNGQGDLWDKERCNIQK